jgi:predicted porin
MKKNILALGIAAAMVAPVSMANAPSVYGLMNFAVDSGDFNAITSGMNMNHRNSRLGFKGAEDIGNGMKVVYQMEATVGYSLINMNRNTFVGVAGGFGTVVLGRHDTPLRMIQPNDGFADSPYAGNNMSRFNGHQPGEYTGSGEHRFDEVLAYLNKFGDINVAVALTGNSGLEKDAGTPNKADQSLTQGMSFSVAYGSKAKGIYAAAAMTSADALNDDLVRVTVQYNEAGLTGSLMYNAFGDSTAITLGAQYKMGDLTPRAKIAMVDNGTTDGMNIAAGVDYALGKKTRTYFEFASLDKNSPAGDASVVSVGLSHSF